LKLSIVVRTGATRIILIVWDMLSGPYYWGRFKRRSAYSPFLQAISALPESIALDREQSSF
jgi:hypothetical protein